MQAFLSYNARIAYATHPLAKRLLQLMDQKKTNLALSLDVTDAKEAVQLVHALGPEIAVLKTHVDIIQNFTDALTQQWRALAEKYQFLIFEDRKFADIGHTVHLQYTYGMYRIADWADMVNAHALPGPEIISGLKQTGLPKARGLILLAEMSSRGHLMDERYAKQVVSMAAQHRDFVIGYVAQHRLEDDPHFLYFTPGVKLEAGSDALGQQYDTPASAIARGADVIIVGRDILQASDPLAKARLYRQAGFDAYLKRTAQFSR